MKAILIIAALVMPNAIFAKPASQIAWTPTLLTKLKQADAEKGKTLAAACTSCHGVNAEGSSAETRDDETIPAIPALAGQLATYTFKQLRDYANGDRENSTMAGIAQSLSEQDAADIALWLSTLTKPVDASNQASPKAQALVKQGDGKRILPPCAVCHGSEGQGEKLDIPALKGQQAGYLIASLLAYKSGVRHNDIYARMRLIAEQLSEQEINELAQYYRSLK